MQSVQEIREKKIRRRIGFDDEKRQYFEIWKVHIVPMLNQIPELLKDIYPELYHDAGETTSTDSGGEIGDKTDSGVASIETTNKELPQYVDDKEFYAFIGAEEAAKVPALAMQNFSIETVPLEQGKVPRRTIDLNNYKITRALFRL